jgi:tRNA(Ile)-lysidine synthase
MLAHSMIHFFENTIYQFFDQHIDQKRPVLLGLSGGADSMCLMHLLVEWRKGKSLEIHLVHVDHGWRSESALEAEKVKALAESLHLPIHITRLQPSSYKGNLEAESRKERFAYFHLVQSEVQAQGILLGHHADDQAETVLKRILEGASLPYLSGIAPKTTYGFLVVMRPLLAVRKKEIVAWLSNRNIDYFHDATNGNPKFLRAKMRTTIFPFLQTAFGKEFDRNLCEIAKEALEFRHYLDELVEPILQKRVESDWGIMIEMWKFPPRALFEWAYLLRKMGKQLDVVMSRYQVTLAVEALLNKKANTQIVTGKKTLICDRGNIFFIANFSKDLPDTQQLTIGKQQYGDWQIIVTLVKSYSIDFFKNDWKKSWAGKCSTVLPEGDYFFGRPEPQMRRLFLGTEDQALRKSKALGRFLNEKKVPNFLISKIPMIFSSSGVVEDFLSGVTVKEYEGPCLHIVMQRERYRKSRGFKD